MIRVRTLLRIKTLQDLKALNIGPLDYDIGGRGGYLGYYGKDVAKWLKIDPSLLPKMVGAYVNYLGGGIRGTVTKSEYSSDMPVKVKPVLDHLLLALMRVYTAMESDTGLNASQYADGDTNWEAMGTREARRKRITHYPGL